jgi:superfamily II DNA or RNA helicase
MNIHISYDNLVANVEPRPLPQDAIERLRYALRYRPDGYQHVYSFKSRKWDGYNYLYDTLNQRFRRGLVPRVVSALQEDGHTVTTSYHGHSPLQVQHKYIEGLVKPVDFQAKSVDVVAQNPIGIIVSPTGSGKTVMISKIVNSLNRVTMILVTDVVLLDQMQQEMQRFFDQPIGIIGDGEFNLQNITVSTIQSLLSIKKGKSIAAADKRVNLINFTKLVGAVISDEAHLYDSASVSDIMELFSSADRFYGMSATPYGWAEKAEKKENLELEQHFGKVIYDTRKANDFISLGLKVPLYVQVMHRDPFMTKYDRKFKKDRFKGEVPDPTANYRDCLETELLKNQQYHEDIVRYANDITSQGNSTFIHAQHSIEFGQSIHDMIPGSVFVHGKTPRMERREIYNAMRKKELLCLVSDVGGTGLDIPSLDSLILASDLQDIRQLKGRVERRDRSPNATKQCGLLIDVHTKTQFLNKHYETRKSQYVHDNHTILG